MRKSGETVADEYHIHLNGPTVVEGTVAASGDTPQHQKYLLSSLKANFNGLWQDTTLNLKELFDKEGIFFAYPQIVIHKSEPKTTSTDDNQEG